MPPSPGRFSSRWHMNSLNHQMHFKALQLTWKISVLGVSVTIDLMQNLTPAQMQKLTLTLSVNRPLTWSDHSTMIILPLFYILRHQWFFRMNIEKVKKITTFEVVFWSGQLCSACRTDLLSNGGLRQVHGDLWRRWGGRGHLLRATLRPDPTNKHSKYY